jgi:hypothetical protein
MTYFADKIESKIKAGQEVTERDLEELDKAIEIFENLCQ